MHPTLSELLDHGPVLIDGAWGTELQRLGLASGRSAEQWNLTRPECVEQVARAYVDAGARVLLTNTFRANRMALRKDDLSDQFLEVNMAGVAIARRVVGNGCHIFGSLGASGVNPSADRVAWREIEQSFREQAGLLADTGVDGLVIETMLDPTELQCGVTAAMETGLPVVACLVVPPVDSETDQPSWARVVEQLEAIGTDVIGANCGCDINDSIAVCRMLNSMTSLPLWIKPNAGLPAVIDGRPVYRSYLGQAASYVNAIRAAGASFFGGCCGTTPEFIRACAAANSDSESA
ncbi:MAG: homocysteine S-methyltransferase family protein [Planctomycetaceae bacterium]